MNVKNVISKAKTNFKTKVVPAVVSAGTAITAVAISASAESVSTGIDYSSVTTSLKSSLSEIVSNCIGIAVDILPIGLGLWGLSKLWDTAKKFFNKSTS